MKKLIFSGVLIVSSIICSAKTPENKELLHRYILEDKSSSDAVSVVDTALVYTGQITPRDLTGSDENQCTSLFNTLNDELAKAGSGLAQIVRLNCYYTKDFKLSAFQTEMKNRLSHSLPAVSYILTDNSGSKARVMCEAVSVSEKNVSEVVRVDDNVSILPKGSKVFISGQAEKATDPITSVHATMTGLMNSLKHLGLSSKDCVQIKAFIKPGLDKADMNLEISSFFEGVPPPIVMIPWIGDYNAEIEMVAAASKPTQEVDSVTYGYFPWLHKSPRYSSFVRVKADTPLIFIGEIESDSAVSSSEQLSRVFERLGTILFKSGSSYRNLVKATYYMGDSKLRTGLGDIRGVYFDPARAPAASAIGVQAFERAGIAFGLDIVAVPASL